METFQRQSVSRVITEKMEDPHTLFAMTNVLNDQGIYVIVCKHTLSVRSKVMALTVIRTIIIWKLMMNL